MSRSILLALLLGLCAWRTHHRAEQWRDEVALWTAARRTTPTLPRPAVNLGLAYSQMGRWEDATTHLVDALKIVAVSDPTGIRRPAARGLIRISVLGPDVCTRPTVAPWCAWGF